MDNFLLQVFDSPGSNEQQVETSLTPDGLRQLLQQKDPSITVDQNGNTVLHKLSDFTGELPTHVYVLAQQGALINVQNKDGETALHTAVRCQNKLIAEALLHCGADVTMTNKMGTSVLHMCPGNMKDLVQRFNPPLHQAVHTGNFAMVCRLLKNWVSVTSRCLSDGQSVLDMAKSKLSEEVFVLRSLQKVTEHRNQSVLIHAVLSDDTDTAKRILEGTKMRTANCRYKQEMSLLSIAIENKNRDMVKLLLDHGVKTNNRVRHRLSQPEDTVPCVLLAYSYMPDLSVAQLLWQYGIHALHQRDKEGNSSLIRAIKHGASLELIEWFVGQTEGKTLAMRNVERLTAYEVADRLGRSDVTTYIDQYVDKHSETLGPLLVAQTYTNLPPRLNQMCHKVTQVIKQLFKSAQDGDADTITSHNTVNYQDINGHTVLHKAVTFSKLNVIKEIVKTRPVLKSISDNHGRYPLHLAFLLPDDPVREEVLSTLLQSNPEHYEYVSDKDGLCPADYSMLPEETKLSILEEVSANT